MTDMEKVIKGLEACSLAGTKDDCIGYGCPYLIYNDEVSDDCQEHMFDDALALLKAQEPITGETSDGYHTFNELYHHRAVLFSVIVANYKDRAWKSVRHHDGTMYDGMFIVGIDTPDGQATYHYDIDPYWDMFDCKVREFAPEWDGHTPAQAIERIGKLKAQEPHWISVEDGLPQEHDTIFAKLYGTDKWRNGMSLKASDDVRVVKVFRDGTKRVHHDHTVDGRWESERKGLDVYGHVTHWMPNPKLPFCTSSPTDE